MSLFLLLQSAAQAADQMPDLTQVAETTVPTEAQINIIDLAFKGGWIMVVLLLLSLLAIVPTLRAVEPSGTLPVLVIETKNRQPIVSKEEYLEGTYYLDPRGCEGVEAFGSAESPLPLQIKGRGNWTWTFNKKPYRLKLDDKAALLGMNKSKHFALLAHADDNRAFMRNATGFEVSRMSGLPWTPADKPCEVILNGDYIGLYFLTETIRFDKKRVNMTNPDDTVDDWLAENPDKTAADYPCRHTFQTMDTCPVALCG